jgi:transposase InsO family protein
MQIHGRAKLGPAGRLALCEAVESGMTFRQVAALFERLACNRSSGWHRYRVASAQKRHSLAWAADRSSRPHRSPGLLDAASQERICEARQRTGWGPRLIAGETGIAHSTVWKVLRRHGLSRRQSQPRDLAHRYEWPCPGDLLHMDTARYARFERPGHRVTKDRSQRNRNWMDQGTGVGYDFAHAIVDDHTRLAYVELHSDERAQTVTGFVTRALKWFETQGITTKRLMSDDAWSYTQNRSLRELLATREIKHLRTKPYRPQTNGKVERFHQIMRREWAYGLSYRSHRHRNRALPHWLEHYTRLRVIDNREGLDREDREPGAEELSHVAWI